MMYRKKLIAILMLVILFLLILPSSAMEVTPRWFTTNDIVVSHRYDNGISKCSIEIESHPQITRIDNIEIELYRLSGSSEMLVKRWPTMSVDNYVFNFYGEADNVQTGYKYRLSVTADVHGLGIIEEVSKSIEVMY